MSVNINNAKEVNPSNYKFAGIWVRLKAGAIDTLILGTVLVAILVCFSAILIVVNDVGGKALNEYPKTTANVSAGLHAVYSAMDVAIYIAIGLFHIYAIIMPATKWQATLGMKIFGIKVVDESRNRVSILRSIVRYGAECIMCYGIVYIYSLFKMPGWPIAVNNCIAIMIASIPYLPIAFHKHKRGFHDLIAKTYVVYQNS